MGNVGLISGKLPLTSGCPGETYGGIVVPGVMGGVGLPGMGE